MAEKTRAQIGTDADSYIPDNSSNEVSPEDVRNRVKDLADSMVSRADDTTAFTRGLLGKSSAAAARTELAIDLSQGFTVPNPTATTHNIVLSATEDGTIQSLTHKLGTGTLTVAVKINGTSVTGLSAVSVTTTKTTTAATALSTFSAGDTISITITSPSGATTFDGILQMKSR